MSLFSHWRSSRSSGAAIGAARTDQQVIALRAALAACGAVAERWKWRLVATTSALLLLLGLLLITNREPLQQAAINLAVSWGIATPRAGIDAAYDAYHNNDFTTALRVAQPLADQGKARAESLLGLIYYYGREVPRNDIEAMKWFRRAADQGNAESQFYLGLMYAIGRGIPQNFAEAAKWYRLAADGGYAQGQFNLGAMNFNGEGVPQSNINAHMWFNLAAAHYPSSDRRNREKAARVRDVVAMKMTPEEIAQAQRMARDWRPR